MASDKNFELLSKRHAAAVYRYWLAGNEVAVTLAAMVEALDRQAEIADIPHRFYFAADAAAGLMDKAYEAVRHALDPPG